MPAARPRLHQQTMTYRTRQTEDAVECAKAAAWVVGWLLFWAVVAWAIGGCKGYSIPAGTGTDDAIGSIKARADVIEHTTTEKISKAQAQAIKQDAGRATETIEIERKAARTEHESAIQFKARWYIRAAVWVHGAWITLLIVLPAAWIGLGLLGAWFAPATWAIRLLGILPMPLPWNKLAYVIGRQK